MQAGILGVPACFLIYQAMKHMKKSRSAHRQNGTLHAASCLFSYAVCLLSFA